MLAFFPEQCKHALVRPLLKKLNLDPEELRNYSPVSNLHFISKIIEKLVAQRLEEHLSRFSLYDSLESAYRSGHSTETSIVKLSIDIVSNLNRGHCVILASLDLSAAFNTVDHGIFLQLEHKYGIYGTSYQWFKSYLHNRQLKVCINSSFSKSHNLKCGVPQGSVLESTDVYNQYTCQSSVKKFILPVSAIVERHNISYHSYADDTQLYIQCDNNEEAVRYTISHLEHCILEICEWMKQNSLKINQDKTKHIVFSSKPDQYKHISLSVGRDIIHPSEYVRILGVTLDSQMSMHQYIANTCRSTYMHIRKINSIRQYLCKNSTASPVNATVLTRLDYFNSVYTGLPQKAMHKLQLAQDSAAILISQTSRHHYITPILIELNWLTIIKRCQYNLLVLTFKVLHSQAPSYISDLFNWYTPARALRLRPHQIL